MNMDIGQTLSNTVSMTFSRLGSLAGLWGVFFIAQMAALLLLGGVIGGGFFSLASFADPSAAGGLGALGGGMILGLFVVYGLYLYLYGAQSVAMTAQASPQLEPNFGRSFSLSFKGGLTFLVVMVLLLIGYAIGTFAFGLLAVALSFLGEIAPVIMALIAIPLIIYLACRLMIVPAVIGVDEVYNPVAAIKRAWKLTRGNVLGIFVTLLVLAFGFVVLFGILFLIAGSGFASLSLGEDAPGIGVIIVFLIAFLVLGILAAAFGAALVAAVHDAVSDSKAEELGDTFA